MKMNKHQVLANVLLAPKEDIPEIIVAAINQWTSDASGPQELFKQVLVKLEAEDEMLHDEVLAVLKDWS